MIKLPQHLLDYWEENGYEPPVQKIVAAACQVQLEDGTIITLVGARHWDHVMNTQFKYTGGVPLHDKQGFIDQFGTYLTREESLDIVLASGQPFDAKRNGVPADQLFSEGLY